MSVHKSNCVSVIEMGNVQSKQGLTGEHAVRESKVVDNFSQLSTGARPLFKPHKNSLILSNFLSLAWISGFHFI